MDCDCNKINCGSGNHLKVPRIWHVQGNVLRIAIPLTLRSLVKDGDEMIATDTDFIPSSEYPVRVVFSKGKITYPVEATMEDNVAIIEDNGKIPVGTYDISVECRDDIGRPYRFKQNAVLQVVDATADAGIDEEIEYEATTWYLNAAVFLATTEIGSMSEEIEQRLETVFGAVEYDENNRTINFYNKDRSDVLGTLDANPFTSDGSVEDVYIDVARQVLVVVNNADAGGRRFNVPLYLIFNDYYKKSQVDELIRSQIGGGVNLINGRVPFDKATPVILASLDGDNTDVSSYNEGDYFAVVDTEKIYQVVNGYADEVGEIDDKLIYCDKSDNTLYRWNNSEFVQVGGNSGSGGITATYSNGTITITSAGSSQPTYSNGTITF